jgi:hypothetical protein
LRILTTDLSVALPFYQQLFGWTFSQDDPLRYSIYNGDHGLGAIIGGQPQPSAPNVVVYVAVDDLRAKIAQAQSLGGTLISGPVVLSPTTAYADVKDPTGTVIGLFTGSWTG